MEFQKSISGGFAGFCILFFDYILLDFARFSSITARIVRQNARRTSRTNRRPCWERLQLFAALKSRLHTNISANFGRKRQFLIKFWDQIHFPSEESSASQTDRIAWAASKRSGFLLISLGATSETDWNRLGCVFQHRTGPLNIFQI